MEKSVALLEIKEIELMVKLGAEEHERRKAQKVLLDIEISHRSLPAACQTDELADTICYATVAHSVVQHVNLKEFKLVEHMAHSVLQIVKEKVSVGHSIRVRVHKHPIVPGIKWAGISFAIEEDL
jgi:dihydroneopterin aldolase